MENYQVFIQQLQALTDHIINHELQDEGKHICISELAVIRGAINQIIQNPPISKHDYQVRLKEIVKIFKEVINNIDKEEVVLEHEMQGTHNFSEYELRRAVCYAYKKALKNKLEAMLFIIYENQNNLTMNMQQVKEYF